MTSKLSQAALQKYYVAYNALVNAVHDKLQRNQHRLDENKVPGGKKGLAGHSLFIKQLIHLDAKTTDYSIFERQLKRRLIKLGHRYFGYKQNTGFGLKRILDESNPDVTKKFEKQLYALMDLLQEVNVEAAHEHLVSVNDILSCSSGTDFKSNTNSDQIPGYLNKEELVEAGRCACYCCMQHFDILDITAWVDKGKTALCPLCGIDAVVPSNIGTERLEELHMKSFKKQVTLAEIKERELKQKV